MKSQNNRTMYLLNELRKGASLNEIQKDFDADLQAALQQLEIEEEEKAKAEEKAKEQDKYRKQMIYAIIDYLTSLGIIEDDNEPSKEQIDKLNNMFKSNEKKYKNGTIRLINDVDVFKDFDKYISRMFGNIF